MDFSGQWIDSLGNDVAVQIVNGMPKTMLKKAGGGWPMELSLFWDHHLRGWRCGNGLLSETVYGRSKGSDEQVLQFVAWMTKDGRISSWTRRPTKPTDSGLHVKAETQAPPIQIRPTQEAYNPPKQKLQEAQEGSDNAKPQMAPTLLETASSHEEQVADPLDSPTKTSRFAKSWFEMTEDWDEEDSPVKVERLFGRAQAEQWSEGSQGRDETSAEKPKRKTRRGRRRPRGAAQEY